ncbi:RNA-binding protein NOB1 [Malaya genurostris]|uniref:RNA-binding protein NOB1 n=1 Tax=Malaya genurostris TaxID=325434 RepID=UPI0026F3E618|nr:RNA-binding protein NOB1 [Malaya genurostris]
MPKFSHLVVDTSAFIKNVQLQDCADNCYTVQGVLDEIKNDRQFKRLVVLPYQLLVREPDSDVLTLVTNIAKKTGDFSTLSLVDLKVIALTYQLEKEFVGVDHLREDPTAAVTVYSSVKPAELAGFGKVQGFYNGEKNHSQEQIDSDKKQGDIGKLNRSIDDLVLEQKFAELNTDEVKVLEDNIIEHIQESQDKFEEDSDHVVEESDEDNDDNDDEDEDDDDDDDDGGWITPANIKEVKRSFGMDLLEENPAVVACMTTDFSMQNVLKQIGLHVAALDGRVIKHARTYIQRCYACFKTTPDSTKVFCPKCGNKTLKKVAVSLDENGHQVIHINSRRPLTARNKNRPVAQFRGGKHSTNPLLFEDQPLPQQRISAKARAKTNALGDDYTAGYSPFVMRDVDSRSAVLRGKSNLKQWMQNYEYDNHRRGYKK